MDMDRPFIAILDQSRGCAEKFAMILFPVVGGLLLRGDQGAPRRFLTLTKKRNLKCDPNQMLPADFARMEEESLCRA